LDVNDTIGAYLSEAPYGNEVTIHHLLTHTSGLPYPNTSGPLSTADAVIESLGERPLKRQPGEKNEYHYYNYLLLGGIVEEVSGMSFEQYLKENFFDPLGMTDTRFVAQDDEDVPLAWGYGNLDFIEDPDMEIEAVTEGYFAPTANGSWGLWSNVDDLYLWDRALYTDDILSQESLEEMYKAHADYKDHEYFRGYGWFVSTASLRRVVRQVSGLTGYQIDIRRYVDDDVTVILLSNFEQSSTVWKLSGKLASIVFTNPEEGDQP